MNRLPHLLLQIAAGDGLEDAHGGAAKQNIRRALGNEAEINLERTPLSRPAVLALLRRLEAPLDTEAEPIG